MLATLDAKLVQLSRQTAEDKTAKEAYDKVYQATLSEVQEKAREVKPVVRPQNLQKSGPTAAGLALMQKQKEFHPVDLTQVVCCFNFTALPLELQLLTIEFLRFVDLKLLE